VTQLPILLVLLTAAAGALPHDERVPGGIAVMAVPGTERPEAWLGDRRVLVTGNPGRWYAVAGIDLDTAPGPGALRVRVDGGERLIAFRVVPRDYPEQQVRIDDQRRVEPLPEDLARIGRETALMDAARARWRDVPAPALALRLPVTGRSSATFGARRIFNGQPRQPHGGMDIAAPEGTPVLAAAAGRVALAGDFFFNGNTVFVDHGQGLLTMYCHLQRIDVRQDDGVEAGTPLGTVGRTGRASGPHLHWSVYLNGSAVNPALLLEAPQHAAQGASSGATSR
jgi:hypothetical protein